MLRPDTPRCAPSSRPPARPSAPVAAAPLAAVAKPSRSRHASAARGAGRAVGTWVGATVGEGQEGEGGRPISSCASIMSYIENLCRKGRVVRGAACALER